jgi:hypothetical protein
MIFASFYKDGGIRIFWPIKIKSGMHLIHGALSLISFPLIIELGKFQYNN